MTLCLCDDDDDYDVARPMLLVPLTIDENEPGTWKDDDVISIYPPRPRPSDCDRMAAMQEAAKFYTKQPRRSFSGASASQLASSRLTSDGSLASLSTNATGGPGSGRPASFGSFEQASRLSRVATSPGGLHLPGGSFTAGGSPSSPRPPAMLGSSFCTAPDAPGSPQRQTSFSSFGQACAAAAANSPVLSPRVLPANAAALARQFSLPSFSQVREPSREARHSFADVRVRSRSPDSFVSAAGAAQPSRQASAPSFDAQASGSLLQSPRLRGMAVADRQISFASASCRVASPGPPAAAEQPGMVLSPRVAAPPPFGAHPQLTSLALSARAAMEQARQPVPPQPPPMRSSRLSQPGPAVGGDNKGFSLFWRSAAAPAAAAVGPLSPRGQSPGGSSPSAGWRQIGHGAQRADITTVPRSLSGMSAMSEEVVQGPSVPLEKIMQRFSATAPAAAGKGGKPAVVTRGQQPPPRSRANNVFWKPPPEAAAAVQRSSGVLPQPGGVGPPTMRSPRR
eukprot:TRINITY_DN30762_c0_g1_i2.p1 TRINITY_DN30762_c0_g1~~TRINITY_DN30762_c0_g1_i2.p1  ORF type:complete len:509 (-),score=91.38 TRINITY_DN30762_c0_g1_i2:14-1540(-)